MGGFLMPIFKEESKMEKARMEHLPRVCLNETGYQEIGGYMVYNHILVEKLPDEFMTNGTLEKEQLKKQFTDHFAMTGQMVACKLLHEW